MAAKFRGPDFSEASRFSVLTPDSSNSSGDEAGKHINDESKKKAKNAKKRARKKKKAAADSVATAELRQLAFGGSSSKQSNVQNSDGVNIPTYVGVHAEERKPACDNPEWIERDEQFIVCQFQEDLEEAVRLSLEDAHSQKLSLNNQNDTAAMKRRKDHSTKLSLAAFQKQPVDSVHNGDIKNLDGFDNVSVNPETKITPKKVMKKKTNAHGVKEEKSKVKSKDEGVKVVKVANDAQVVNNDPSLDKASLNYWKNQVEEKDKAIELLTNINRTMTEEISEVKKRNKQLCFILGQGEMRDKSEILQQVDTLTNIRDELSSEISELHSQLEQERSKVSALRIELAKVQNGRSKKHSHTENDHR